MPKLFDAHCHLNLEEFKDDWSEVLDCTLAGDCWLVNVGADLASSKQAVQIAKTKNEGVWATVGVHPTDSVSLSEDNWQELETLASDSKVVAIGECGLEYFRNPSEEEKSKQKEIFERQIKLAIKLNKPLMIHGRPSLNSQDAYEDILNILEKYKAEAGESLRGDMHFFAGNLAIAECCLKLGFTLSFTGVITFSSQYDEVIKNTPLDRILAETDAPYVAPVPYRGKRCEPLYVAETVKKLAELKGISFDEMAQITTQNARNLYGV